MAEPVTCPGAPTPTVEVISSTYASISWDAVDGVDKYVLAIRDNTTGEGGIPRLQLPTWN